MRIESREQLADFFSNYISKKKVKKFMAKAFNPSSGPGREKFMSKQLEAAVKHYYRRDYELYYPELI